MRFAAKHLVLLPLQLDTAAWVPYGYVCIPSALQTQQNKTTADMVHEVAFVWHLTMLNKSFLQELPEKVWAAIQTSNGPHLSRAGSTPVRCRLGRTFSQRLLFSRSELLLQFTSLHGGKERNLHAVNSLSVDAQFLRLAGEFTLDSCCMCGETCKKHGNTGCSCVENESKRDVAYDRRCPKTSNEKHHLLNNLINNIHIHVLVHLYMYKRVHRYITINIDIHINNSIKH